MPVSLKIAGAPGVDPIVPPEEHKGMQEGWAGWATDSETKLAGWGCGSPMMVGGFTGPTTFRQFLFLFSYGGIGQNENVHLSRTSGSPL